MRRLFAVGLVLLVSPAAFAHKMEVAAKIPAESLSVIRVEVGYDTDEPTEKATVTLLDAAGQVVAVGVTDAKGVCTLPRPKAGTYTIRGDDGAGHRTEVTLVVPVSETEVAEAHTAKRNRTLMAVAGLATIAILTVGLAIAARTLSRKRVRE